MAENYKVLSAAGVFLSAKVEICCGHVHRNDKTERDNVTRVVVGGAVKGESTAVAGIGMWFLQKIDWISGKFLSKNFPWFKRKITPTVTLAVDIGNGEMHLKNGIPLAPKKQPGTDDVSGVGVTEGYRPSSLRRIRRKALKKGYGRPLLFDPSYAGPGAGPGLFSRANPAPDSHTPSPRPAKPSTSSCSI